MSRTTDPGLFFQTESSLGEIQRKSAKSANNNGDPVKLPSKILGVLADPTDRGRVFVVESAATARRVVLDYCHKSKTISHVYRGPGAPLSSLALSPDSTTLLAGCWDKSIWSWDVESRKPGRRFIGHADFVKAVLCMRLANIQEQPVKSAKTPAFEDLLVSGGADSTIIVWSLATGSKLHVLKGHPRGILHLAVYPASQISDESSTQGSSLTIFSAGSDREIHRWKISVLEAVELDATNPVAAHETSVNKLCFVGGDGDTDNTEPELWTASSDKTAKCLTRVAPLQSGLSDNDQGKWEEDTLLPHPDFVRDIAVETQNGLVVTACRDEEVRVWDKASAELIHIYSGHFEEVTGLVIIGGGRDSKAVSVSIDGTIRQWNIGSEWLSKSRNGSVAIKPIDSSDREKGVGRLGRNEKVLTALTDEEEKELAELMDADE